MAMAMNYSATMRPNRHEKNEWSRMAQDAYRNNLNSIGHTYSTAASLPHDGTLTTEYFDQLQRDYRAWLINGSHSNMTTDLAYLDRLTRWIDSHPTMLAGRNDNGTPIIQVEALQTQTGERWTEFSSVWTMAGAREVLGY